MYKFQQCRIQSCRNLNCDAQPAFPPQCQFCDPSSGPATVFLYSCLLNGRSPQLQQQCLPLNCLYLLSGLCLGSSHHLRTPSGMRPVSVPSHMAPTARRCFHRVLMGFAELLAAQVTQVKRERHQLIQTRVRLFRKPQSERSPGHYNLASALRADPYLI